MNNTSCTLEHCHTNLFALQNLPDVKWKCYRRISTDPSLEDEYRDPVLKAFWQEYHAERLCAWRRVLADDGLRFERELWLFAIQEDLPNELPNLRVISQTTGARSESVMSYECRSMLFKALHNMIEKYFLSRGFARLNRWFVLPVNHHSDVKVANLSFNFQFFLHGDSKICASVDVQRHDEIFHLTSDDLEEPLPSDVILAPYGLSGKLIGSIDRDVDLKNCRENWMKNYPLKQLEGLPEFVQVTAGPLRMFYPTCYVYKIPRSSADASKKKSDNSAIGKPKSSSAEQTMSRSTTLFDLPMIKQTVNHLLINVQRTNTLDQEKKLDHPSSRRSCDCPSISSRPVNSLIPFHRRPRPMISPDLPSNTIDSTPSSSSPIRSSNTNATATTTTSVQLPEEKSLEWSVPSGATPLHQPPSIRTSHGSNEINTNGKRPWSMVFDDWKIDEDEDEKEQTYDFSLTDNFLQSVFKRIRTDEPSTDSFYPHPPATSPSPAPLNFDGPSMNDLDVIIQPNGTSETNIDSHQGQHSSNEIHPISSPINGTELHPTRLNFDQTSPGSSSSSSSSEKFRTVPSPNGIIGVEMKNQFESFGKPILVPFPSHLIEEQSIYHRVRKSFVVNAPRKYSPSNLRHYRSKRNSFETIPRLFNHFTPQSQSTVNPFSPRHPTDPLSNRSSLDSVSFSSSSPSDIDSFRLNLILNDSLLNLFRDTNFDSCVLCACTSKISIHGQDALIYLDPYLSPSIPQPSISSNRITDCSCGFSAVINLRSSLQAGLFYEDEIDLTGVKSEVKYRETNEKLSVPLLNLIERCESFFSPFESNPRQSTELSSNREHLFQKYENAVCRSAMEQARLTSTLTIDLSKHQWFHPWSSSFTALDSNQQLIAMLRSLQPLLTDALHRRSLTRYITTIDGPLTWKSFHHLLHVQSQHAQLEEQSSGPQAIPYLLTGFDQEWMMLAPYGLKFWDKLALEPYSKRKDLYYLAILPDNDYLSSMTKFYFRELSANYELARLGSHRPWTKYFPDQGLLKINDGTAETRSIEVDPWFNEQENLHPLGKRLKFYVQILKEKLFPHLSTSSFDVTLFEDHSSRRETSRLNNDLSSPSDLHHSPNDLLNNINLSSASPSSSSMMTNVNGSMLNDSASNLNNNSTAPIPQHQIDPVDLQLYESFYHGRTLNDDQVFLVLYFVDTFRYECLSDEHSNFDEQREIYLKKGLLRLYLDLVKDLPEKTNIHIHFQVIPAETILQHQIESDGEFRLTHFKRLSFHIYEQLKRTISHRSRAKSHTGFGPAATEDKAPSHLVLQLYTPPYVLSPKWDFRFKSFADPIEQMNQNGSILFCSYCLSDDQRFVLVSCSDERGELKETCSINIEVPDRHQKKVQYAARHGLKRVWDFILRIVTSTTMPWRIVIGRLGRLGHGELKYWGILLAKKNLVRYATAIREDCPMCRHLRSHDHPMILSACLISFESHPLLRILPESLELGEMRGTQASNNNNSNLPNSGQILNDISVTHILTLPTSASVQHLQNGPRLNDARQFSTDIDDYFFDSFLKEGLSMEDFEPVPNSPPGDVDYGAGNHLDMSYANGVSFHRLNSLNTSNGHMHFVSQTSTANSMVNHHRSHLSITFDQEIDMNENPSLNQQPLALGFYVSTIGTLNPLPSWMFQSPRSSLRSSSVFKATLHINVPNAQHSDDMLIAQNHEQKSSNPLDSNYTYVVLRHVLESYHRLSWLLIDTKNNERASCLPIHLETLLRLYQAFIKYV